MADIKNDQNTFKINSDSAKILNDYDSIICSEINDNEIGIGIVVITDNNIVYRGIINTSDDLINLKDNQIYYIKEIIDSLATIKKIKIVYCSSEEKNTNELHELFNDIFNNYMNEDVDYSFEYRESNYLMIDTNGLMKYDNNEINKIK